MDSFCDTPHVVQVTVVSLQLSSKIAERADSIPMLLPRSLCLRHTGVRESHPQRYAGGDERCGRRRVGLLNPLSGETHKQGMHLDRWTKQKISNRKKRFARKGRRRTRPERRRNAKTSQNVARARSRTGELNIATWNVRSLSLTGRRGAGHAEVLLQKCKVLGCDVIRLQETRRPGRTEFATAGYRVSCSGVDRSTGRAGQHGVGLAVKESIIREATWTQELTNERLMSMTFNLTGKSNTVTFIVAYGPTNTVSNTREQKAVFWADWKVLLAECPAATICLF